MAAGWGLGLAVAGLAVWAARRVRRSGMAQGKRRVVLGLLLLAVVSTPLVPSPMVTLRVERTRYAGPDLLSDIPVRMETRRTRWVVPGLSRIRDQRRVQDDRLLDEVRRAEVVVPWFLGLVVAGSVGAAAVRPRPPGKGV